MQLTAIAYQRYTDFKVIWGYLCKAGPLVAIKSNSQEIPVPVTAESWE